MDSRALLKVQHIKLLRPHGSPGVMPLKYFGKGVCLQAVWAFGFLAFMKFVVATISIVHGPMVLFFNNVYTV